MFYLLQKGNAESRLRRSLAACALEFILICRCCIFCFILQIDSLLRLNRIFHSQDIPRTFPGHPALDENGRNSLRRLLLAYARHNPSVGYCQVTIVVNKILVNTDSAIISECLNFSNSLIKFPSLQTSIFLARNKEIEIYCAIGKFIYNVQKLMVIFPYYEKLVSAHVL